MNFPYPLWLVPIVIATLVIRWWYKKYQSNNTDSKTPDKKEVGWFWPVGIIAVIVIGLLVWKACGNSGNHQATGGNPREEWVFTSELPAGQYVRGLNKTDPLTAEVDFRRDGSLWVDLLYTEYGRAEKTKFRLGNVGDKSWEGPWSQANPADEGRCNLHQVSPGNLAGTMTGTSGLTAFCTLIKKK